MSEQAPVIVQLDERIRLISAALAATSYPEMAQKVKRHHAHTHARQSTKYLHDRGADHHPAVLELQRMLDMDVSLRNIFSLMANLPWPGLSREDLPAWALVGWNDLLWQWYEDADLATFWNDHHDIWNSAVIQCANVFKNAPIKGFLEQFLGPISQDLVFVPNICYPANHEIGIDAGQQLLVVVPPPLAWGDSPPWPYDEETMLMHSYRAILIQASQILLDQYLRAHAEKVQEASQKDLPIGDQLQALYPTWESQFIALFGAAIVAIYLEDYMNQAEARAYMLMEKKVRGMTILPGTVSVLRRFLQERGNKFETLADFLGVFPTQLRVAKKIVTL